MEIRVRIEEFSEKRKKTIVKNVDCEVASLKCKDYLCLQVGKILHQGNITGSQISYRDDFYSCLQRNYNGCPTEPDKFFVSFFGGRKNG